MTISERKQIEKIKNYYTEQEPTKIDELKAKQKKVTRPAQIVSYAHGTIGSLVLGTGMCFAMKVIGTSLPFAMHLGIGIGVLGIAMVSVNYALYKKMIKRRKKKFGSEILSLSNELLNNY